MKANPRENDATVAAEILASELRMTTKLYACDRCSSVVAVAQLVNDVCHRMFATPVGGVPNEAFPIACGGKLQPLALSSLGWDLASGPDRHAEWPVGSTSHAPIGG